MFDKEYCTRMRPLIKLQLIFVGCFLLLPLFTAAVIYVSAAFGYCQNYDMKSLQVNTQGATSLQIGDGVTAIINHGVSFKTDAFKAVGTISGEILQILVDKPLFPCARLVGELDLSGISTFNINNAAILSLKVSDIIYQELKIDSQQTISQLEFINCTAEEINAEGTGALNFSGTVGLVKVAGASSLLLNVNLLDGILEASLTGSFYANASNFKSITVTTVNTGANQVLCAPIEQLQGACAVTLNKHWSGDSGLIYYIDGERKCSYTRQRGSDPCDDVFVGTRNQDEYIVCFGIDYAPELVKIRLDNRGNALVHIYSGDAPDICKRE